MTLGKTNAVFCTLVCAALFLSAAQSHADFQGGYSGYENETVMQGAFSKGSLYVHTLREAKKNIGKNSLVEGTLIPAENVRVKNEDGGCVVLVLSNGTVIFANTQADFTIDKFEQVHPFKMSVSDDMEATPSRLTITLKSGKIYVFGKYPRPASKTFINMKFGTFEPQSSAYVASAAEEASRIDLLEGQTRFVAKDANKTDFFQQGQSGVATPESLKGNYPLSTNPINDLEKESYYKTISLAKNAAKSIYFQFSGAGKLVARRILPKEFFLKKPEYDFRPY